MIRATTVRYRDPDLAALLMLALGLLLARIRNVSLTLTRAAGTNRATCSSSGTQRDSRATRSKTGPNAGCRSSATPSC